MRQAIVAFVILVPTGLLAASVSFQQGPTLGGSSNAALYDFIDGQVASAEQVNNNFKLVADAINDNDTRLTAAETDHNARLTALERIAARVSCDNITEASARTYTALNTQLDADPTGASVCGADAHVCNYQEVTTYALVGGCDPGDIHWIVGGFSNIEEHRRSILNGQDATQCMADNYPTWWSEWLATYDGRVHCMPGTSSYPVSCCLNQ